MSFKNTETQGYRGGGEEELEEEETEEKSFWLGSDQQTWLLGRAGMRWVQMQAINVKKSMEEEST